MLEGPAHKPQAVKYLTMDPGAIGNADEIRSDISFKVLEGLAHKPHTVKYPTVDPGATGNANESRSVWYKLISMCQTLY